MVSQAYVTNENKIFRNLLVQMVYARSEVLTAVLLKIQSLLESDTVTGEQFTGISNITLPSPSGSSIPRRITLP
jgi:hypothetical protein